MSLYDSLYQYVAPAAEKVGITGDRVVFDWENGIRLKSPFLSISVDQFESDSAQEVRVGPLNENDYPEYVDYLALVTVTLDLYGDDAILLSEQIKQYFHHNAAYELSCFLKLGFVDLTPTLNLTSLLGGEFEHRARFKLRIHYGFRYEETIGTIGHVPLLGTLQPEDRVFFDKTVDEP